MFLLFNDIYIEDIDIAISQHFICWYTKIKPNPFVHLVNAMF